MKAPEWCERAGALRYVTLTPYPITLAETGAEPVSTAPAGYPFDASIPWFLRWIISPHDPRVRRASLYHDWLLHNAKWRRELADAVFVTTLIEDGVPPRLARAMGLAVTTFGWRRPKELIGQKDPKV